MADVADTITTGPRWIKITTTGVDDDADKSENVIDIEAAAYKHFTHAFGYPKKIAVQAVRTGGATDVIEVGVEGTNISSTVGFTQIAKAVSSTGSDLVGEEDVPVCRYWRMHAVTVGAGNTLTTTVVLEF